MKRLVVLFASSLAMTGQTTTLLGESPKAVQVTAAEESVAATSSKVRRSVHSDNTPKPLAVTAAAEPVLSAKSATRKLVDRSTVEPVRRSSTAVRRSLYNTNVVAAPAKPALEAVSEPVLEPIRETTSEETRELAAPRTVQPESARAVVALPPRLVAAPETTSVPPAATPAPSAPSSLMKAYRPQSVTARISEASTSSSVVAAMRNQPPVPAPELEAQPATPTPPAPAPIPMADEAAPPQVANHTPEPIVLDDYEPYCDSCHHGCYGPIRLCHDIKASARRMYQHFPYEVWPWTYYYFRPYNYRHVAEQQEQAAAWGADPRQPYSRAVFDRVYEELAKQFEPMPDAE